MSRCIFPVIILPVLSLLSAMVLHAAAPTLAVDANAAQHPISPLIYGINEWTDSGLSAIMRIGTRRWGGDNATSYNWQLDLKNNDDDWYFTTYAVGDGVHSTFNLFHERNLETGTVSLGTVPVLDWTPKPPPAGTQDVGGVLSCSFNTAKYGAQAVVDPYDQVCGNGLTTASSPYIVNDPNDVYNPITPAFAGQWIQSILSKYGAANDGGVQMWSLDNEPEWWDGVHADMYHQAGVAAQPATYDDMLARDTATAVAVKAADPTALITGPVPSGWWGMLFSKKDLVNGWATSPYCYYDNPVDQNAHGGVPWVAYYLRQMNQFEQTNGYRLLDYLDVHAYITPPNIGFDTNYSSANTALRLSSTRAFWDTNYIVPGFANCQGYYDTKGNPVAPALVPTMRGWVSANYPGTKTAITEYNWGALEDITGAVAQADILGIFGREKLDMATMWPDGNFAAGVPGAFAFQIYLNYDGNGNQFGETSISATTSDADTLSIFAAQRSDMALTVLVLNKTSAAIADTVSLANFTPAGAAQVWQYSSTNLKSILRMNDLPVTSGAIAATFPAYSMTLFVVPESQSAMPVPKPIINWVKNAASWNATAIAPGEIVAIQGTSVGGSQLLTTVGTTFLPPSLSGIRVLFNGVPGTMVYTAPISGDTQQLAAIVPYEIAANPATTTVNVQVEVQGNRSDPFPMPVTTVLPGLFTNDASGQNQAAALNQDNPGGLTRNGPLNPNGNPRRQPATRGSYILLFATGEGQTTPPGVDGRLAYGPYPKPALNCSVNIGGVDIVPDYCGAVPTVVAGELQLNVHIPMNVPTGDAVPVQITAGGVTSPAGVTIAVQ